MSDLVVTVPKWFWQRWIDEGDAAGDPASGQLWGFYVGSKPSIERDERLYIVAHGKLRGYAPVIGVAGAGRHWSIQRAAGAVAVTIPPTIPGFRGFRKRWWERVAEVPFPDWKTP